MIIKSLSLESDDNKIQEEEVSSSSVFFASLKSRECLNPQSEKKTYHLVLNLDGSDLHYSVGDCVGIYPQNDPELVKKILFNLRLSGEEPVLNRAKQKVALKVFLQHHANLSRIPTKLGGKDFFDFLQQNSLELQDLCDSFLPLLPRFYSIASSMHVVKKEIHLTVALSLNDADSIFPYGTCSYFLCCTAPLNTPCLPIFIQKTKHFFLSPDSFDKPLIMIGPGTGIAPFRGFMQERLFHNASAQNWLFFGERNQAKDFYYKDFWHDLEAKQFLKLSCAFSRDQSEKIYVQHRMKENGKEVWDWIRKGAYIYVCGDAKHMAKDVDKTLQDIAVAEGNLELDVAKEFMRNLKRQGRYLRDVY